MNEFVTYIMVSLKNGKTYVGMTSNLIARFKSHNSLGTKGWAIKHRPWKVIHVEFFPAKTEALQREKYFKSGAGRKSIQENILPQAGQTGGLISAKKADIGSSPVPATN